MGFETVDADDLTDEQKQQFEDMDALRMFQHKLSLVQEAIQEEARQQQRWIESQIWLTDYEETKVLDVVTYPPTGPGQDFRIDTYRYGYSEDVPEEESYSKESGRQTTVQRVTAVDFRRLVEEEKVDPPEFIPEWTTHTGKYGPGDEDAEFVLDVEFPTEAGEAPEEGDDHE